MHKNHIDFEPKVGDAILGHVHARGKNGKLYAFKVFQKGNPILPLKLPLRNPRYVYSQVTKSCGESKYDDDAVHRSLLGIE